MVVVGTRRDRLVEILEGALPVVEDDLHLATVGIGPAVGGVAQHGGGEVGNRLVHLAGLHVENATLVGGGGMLGIELQCRIELRHGTWHVHGLEGGAATLHRIVGGGGMGKGRKGERKGGDGDTENFNMPAMLATAGMTGKRRWRIDPAHGTGHPCSP